MNERQLSALFSGFWNATLPNLETVVRTLNLAPERAQPPLVSRINASRRDIVSETAFRSCCLAPKGNIDSASATQAFQEASTLLSTKEQPNIPRLDDVELKEVEGISFRIRQFVSWVEMPQRLEADYEPLFSGIGALETCKGDIRVGEELIEIKCVDRGYRSVDFRQVLIYSALEYLKVKNTFARLTLYNPLRGTYVSLTPDEITNSAGGKTKSEFFSELSYLLGSGEISR
jgi:hypothetical protein